MHTSRCFGFHGVADTIALPNRNMMRRLMSGVAVPGQMALTPDKALVVLSAMPYTISFVQPGVEAWTLSIDAGVKRYLFPSVISNFYVSCTDMVSVFIEQPQTLGPTFCGDGADHGVPQ
jgi:hypothetical protein